MTRGPAASGTARRVVVIGCGDVSEVHFAALERNVGVELVGVCDIEPGPLAAATTRYGVPGFDDHREMLRRLEPDTVHVCTPHDEHLVPALDALAAGSNVVLEKPLAQSLEDAELLAATAESSVGQLGVCLQNRYNATAQAAHRAVASGELGAVRAATASLLWSRIPGYYTVKPWRGSRARAGGGVLITQAFHTIDLLLWLLGPVTSVQGSTAALKFGDVTDVEDTALVVLQHASGATTALVATVANAVDEPVSIDIAAERASLHLRHNLTIVRPDGHVERTAADAAGDSGRAYWGPSHARLIGDFYSSLDAGRPVPVGAEQALAVHRILAAIYDHDDGSTILQGAT